jgi:hypothetical protein
MTYFDDSSVTRTTRGFRKPSSGGTGALCHPIVGLLLIRSLSSSQVFPTVAAGDDNSPDFRDMEGPSMRELMEIERAARMSREATGAANV